jgi:hypothetical protein
MKPGERHNIHQPTKGHRGMSGLLGDVTRGMRELVREELRIARSEVSDKAMDFATDAGIVAAGGAVTYAGYLTILGGVVDGMKDLGVPRWLAGVLVGSMAMAGGAALILRGLDNLQLKEPVVDGTKQQMREAVDEVRHDVV